MSNQAAGRDPIYSRCQDRCSRSSLTSSPPLTTRGRWCGHHAERISHHALGCYYYNTALGTVRSSRLLPAHGTDRVDLANSYRSTAGYSSRHASHGGVLALCGLPQFSSHPPQYSPSPQNLTHLRCPLSSTAPQCYSLDADASSARERCLDE